MPGHTVAFLSATVALTLLAVEMRERARYGSTGVRVVARRIALVAGALAFTTFVLAMLT